MPTERASTLCGLYLDFMSIRSCVERMKTAGIRTTDVTMVLPDGSIMSAISTPRPACSSEDSDTTTESIRPKDMSFTNALTRTLFSLGIPAYDSERLESKIRNGGILVSVRCTRLLVERVREIFIQTDALDVSFTRDAGAPYLETHPAPSEQRYTSPSIDGCRQHAAHA